MAGIESTSKPAQWGKRGPYKQYLRDPNYAIPRQTLSNWRKRGFEDTNVSLCAPEINGENDTETSHSHDLATDTTESESESDTKTSHSHDECDCPPTSTDIASSSSSETASTPPTQSFSPIHNLLYPGAQISEATGALLLHSMSMKHGLTYAALTDLQQLLCLHLPAGPVCASPSQCLMRQV